MIAGAAGARMDDDMPAESFERRSNAMRERRRGAIDPVMVHIDESLTLNGQALASLRVI